MLKAQLMCWFRVSGVRGIGVGGKMELFKCLKGNSGRGAKLMIPLQLNY